MSDDEGYLLEDEQPIAKAELSVEACREFFTSDIKSVKSNKKKKKIVTPYWRPKTRATNKLRWNMKKLLNPKLVSKQETILTDSSSSEGPKVDKINITGNRKSIQSESELFTIFFEIRNELIKQQQKEKAEIPPVEVQKWEDEDEFILREANILKDPDIPDLLNKDVDILDISSFEQEIMTGRSVGTNKESLQKIIRQYKEQMKHMQEVNQKLMMANRKLKEELRQVNNHFHELTALSKEVLKRKGTTDRHCTELEKTVENL